MSTDSADELRQRVATLEAQNAALRRSAEATQRRSADATQRGSAGRPRRRRSRAVAAVVLIVLGVLLAPVAVVSGWATWTLTDTQRFVATYAPLAQDPDLKAYVVDQAVAAIDEQVDIDALSQQVVDGVISLGTGPRATAALQVLQGSLTDALRTQIREGVTAFVGSEEFDAAWAEALRVGHRQLVATLGNDPGALATIDADGSLGIPLGPIIEQVKQRLVARGLTIAERIPTIDQTLVLVQSEHLPRVQLAYGAVVGVGPWLPWVVLALLVGGVAVANRRHRAVVWAGIGLALSMALLAVGIATGRIVLVATVPATVLPSSVSILFYDAVTASMQATAIAAVVLGLAVAVVGWFAGPFATPTRVRTLYLDGAGRLRSAAAERGLSTGRAGLWVHRRRSLLLAGVGVVAGGVLVANLPVTVGLVGWTAVCSLLAVVVITLAERPPASAEESTPPASTDPG